MTKFEGLTSGIWGRGLGVLRGAKEPEEGDNDEVDAVFVEGSMDGVCGVQDVKEVSQGGDIGRVGPAWRVVVIGESLEEIFP